MLDIGMGAPMRGSLRHNTQFQLAKAYKGEKSRDVGPARYKLGLIVGPASYKLGLIVGPVRVPLPIL